MIFLIEMVEDKDLILGNELQEADTVFFDKPSDKIVNGLLLKLENMITLRIFAMKNLNDYFFFSLSFEELLHLKKELNILKLEFREGHFVFN